MGESSQVESAPGRLLTVAEVAARLGCTKWSVYRHLRAPGGLVRFDLAGQLRVPLWSVERYEREQAAAAARGRGVESLTYDELAALWGTSRRTLQRLVEHGVLPVLSPLPGDDGRVRVPLSSVREMERAGRVPGRASVSVSSGGEVGVSVVRSESLSAIGSGSSEGATDAH